MATKQSPKSDIPQGTLDLLILRVTALGPIHGYAIAQRMQQVSRDVLQVQQGSLYPALHQLERKGFLRSEWRTAETGRKRKYYSLTSKGRRQAEYEQEGWKHFTDAINLILTSAQR